MQPESAGGDGLGASGESCGFLTSNIQQIRLFYLWLGDLADSVCHIIAIGHLNRRPGY